MCGYCIEAMVLQAYAEAASSVDGLREDPAWRAVYLQEAVAWESHLLRWPKEYRAAGLMVALCRYWADRVAGVGMSVSPWSVFEPLAVQRLGEVAHSGLLGPEWAWVTQQNDGMPLELPVASSIDLLESYVRGWLTIGNGEPRWASDEFAQRVLFVFVALIVLIQHNSGHALIQKLALTDPIVPPAFEGWDIWLQRRATAACISHSGLEWVEKHFDSLRLEQIGSAVMSGAVCDGALGDLLGLVERQPHWALNFDSNDLCRIIGVRLSKRYG
jgi:hypothetical protein